MRWNEPEEEAWREVFAWLPVYCREQRVTVWLEWVSVREFDTGNTGYSTKEYRAL